jgi:hypothetical protein
MKLKALRKSRKNLHRKKTRGVLKRKRTTIRWRGGEPYACKGPSEDDPTKTVDKEGCDSAIYDELARFSKSILAKLDKTQNPNISIETIAKDVGNEAQSLIEDLGETNLQTYLESNVTPDDMIDLRKLFESTIKSIKSDNKYSEQFKRKYDTMFRDAISTLDKLYPRLRWRNGGGIGSYSDGKGITVKCIYKTFVSNIADSRDVGIVGLTIFRLSIIGPILFGMVNLLISTSICDVYNR